MTASSAKLSIVSDPGISVNSGGLLVLDNHDLHLWRCPVAAVSGSDEFRRRVLSHYAAVAPDAWRFETNENGKPHQVGTLPGPLAFNLSHSGEWLVCAVTCGVPVGVDLEYRNVTRDTMKLARRFFRATEVAALQSCSAEQRGERFYHYWTLKEAGIKARGETLGPGLDRRGFELCYPDAGDTAGIRVTPPDPASTACYQVFDMEPGYSLAFCYLPETRHWPRLRFLELRDSDSVVGGFEVSPRAASSLR